MADSCSAAVASIALGYAQAVRRTTRVLLLVLLAVLAVINVVLLVLLFWPERGTMARLQGESPTMARPLEPATASSSFSGQPVSEKPTESEPSGSEPAKSSEPSGSEPAKSSLNQLRPSVYLCLSAEMAWRGRFDTPYKVEW
jgi:hypothetical protein